MQVAKATKSMRLVENGQRFDTMPTPPKGTSFRHSEASRWLVSRTNRGTATAKRNELVGLRAPGPIGGFAVLFSIAILSMYNILRTLFPQ